MIDIHCHILPSIDDGPKDEETSIDMLKIAAEDGIKSIIATPHFEEMIKPTVADVKDRISMLKQKAAALGINLYTGMEVYLTPETPDDLKKGKLLTLADSKYLLVEFPFQQIPPYIDNILFEIMVQGKVPVIAHPERYREIIDNPNILLKYLDKGALAQVNSWSIMGYFGPDIKTCAKSLVSHNMVHFLASDAHSNRKRKPILTDALEKITQFAGTETADTLTQNATKILKDAVVVSNHQPIQKKRSLLSYLPKVSIFN